MQRSSARRLALIVGNQAKDAPGTQQPPNPNDSESERRVESGAVVLRASLENLTKYFQILLEWDQQLQQEALDHEAA
jgi:hypothetical protein